MKPERVRETFRQPVAVEHYTRAAREIGLWRSETTVFCREFRERDSLLDLGCGAGRIAFGLWELGYRRLLGIDYCGEMIREARRLARLLDYGIAFRRADAAALPLDDGALDGVIFGFNGLMQIPGRERRRRAMREIRRVTRRGGRFVFTTHDREHRVFRDFLRLHTRLWARGDQPQELEEFGDNFFRAPEGEIFMHLPNRAEIMEDLEATGWRHESDVTREEIAEEPAQVRRFSDECRFWVAARE